MPTVNILVLGDSNTDAGMAASTGGGNPWATNLKNGLAAAYPITTFNLVDKGHSGQNSAQLLTGTGGYPGIASDLAGQHPDIICIMMGTNDAYALGYTATGDIENYTVDPNLTLTDATAINAYDGVGFYGGSYGGPYWPQFVSWLRANVTNSTGGVPLIVAMSPPSSASYPDQIGATVSGGTVASWPYTRPTRNLLLMQSKLSAFAAANGVVFADIYAEISGHSNWLATLMYDGVHLNATGRQYTANAVMSALVPHLDASGSVSSATFGNLGTLSLAGTSTLVLGTTAGIAPSQSGNLSTFSLNATSLLNMGILAGLSGNTIRAPSGSGLILRGIDGHIITLNFLQ